VLRCVLLSLALIASASPGWAHLASDSYLQIEIVDDRTIRGQWDIALRDLDVAVGLDTDQDGKITWGELHRKAQEIEAYAFGRLALDRGGRACTLARRICWSIITLATLTQCCPSPPSVQRTAA
jgi:hypothetical protein